MIYKKSFGKIINFSVKCSFDSTYQNNNVRFDGKAKIDSGADITVFPASLVLGLRNTNESGFTKWLQQNENVSGIKAGQIHNKCLFAFKNLGIDSSADVIASYAFQVNNFVLHMDNGALCLGKVPITVTFDDRFEKVLIGKDLISLLNISINCDDMRLEIGRTHLLDKVISDNSIIDGVYMQKNGYYKTENLFNANESTTDTTQEWD